MALKKIDGPKPKPLRHISPVSRAHLGIFILVFAAIGGVIIWRSLAAPNVNLPGDLNNDNTVNITDLSILLSDYNTSNVAADINSDGTVNVLDLSILLSHYGQSIVQAVPSIPTGLSATAGSGSVALKWNANPTGDAVDTYQVYWTTDSAWATNSNNLNVTGTSYTVSGLTNGTTYYFRISAHNSAGYGPWGIAISSVPAASGGGGGGTTTGVAPPQAPSSYAPPAGAVTVSSSSTLASALAGSTRDIILANGTYTSSTDMKIGTHRLWGQTLGGATLNFGLELGNNASGTGPEIHGLRFNVTSSAATLGGDVLNVWSASGQNAVIDDSWISGNNILDAGILSRTTNGLQIHRVVVNGFNSYGIFFETYYPDYYNDNPATPPVITDADISAVYRPSRGSSNGTAEAGIWAGTAATVSRVRIRDIGWQGIWTGGNANNGTYSDFDIDNIHGTVPGTSSAVSIAVYLEHYSRSNIFKNFVIGNSSATGVKVGFNCEWADPAYVGTNPVAGQSISGCHFNTIQDGTIYSSFRGTQLQDAEKTTIQRVKFVGQTNAGIDDFMTSGSGYSTIWQGLGNDFSGLAPGAVQYTTAH